MSSIQKILPLKMAPLLATGPAPDIGDNNDEHKENAPSKTTNTREKIINIGLLAGGALIGAYWGGYGTTMAVLKMIGGSTSILGVLGGLANLGILVCIGLLGGYVAYCALRSLITGKPNSITNTQNQNETPQGEAESKGNLVKVLA